MRGDTIRRQDFTYFTVWVKREGMQSEESEIYDGIFEGSVRRVPWNCVTKIDILGVSTAYILLSF